MKLTNQQYEAAVRRYDRLMNSLGLEENTVNGSASLIHDEVDGIEYLVNRVKNLYAMYFEDGTIFSEMRHDDDPSVRKTWRSEKDKLRRFIDAYDGYEFQLKAVKSKPQYERD